MNQWGKFKKGSAADTTPPGIPTGLTIGTRTDSSIAMSWTATTDVGGSGLGGYTVWRSATQSGLYVQLASVSAPGTSFTDTNLVFSTTYWYKLSAYDNANNQSGLSSAVSGLTLADTTAPTVPTSVSVTNPTNSSLTVHWLGSTDVNGSGVAAYLILRSTTQNGSYVQVGSVSVGTLVYTDPGLAASTTYWYKVQARDVANNVSAASVTAASGTTTAASALAWTIPNTLYDLGDFAPSAVTPSLLPLTTVPAGSTPAFTFSSGTVVSPNVATGAFQVSGSDGTYTSVIDLQEAALPVAANLTFVANVTSISLSWDNAVGETGYYVERNDPELGWVQIVSLLTDVVTYLDTGLTAATTYMYRVVAHNAVANGPYSNTVSATTQSLGAGVLPVLILSNGGVGKAWTVGHTFVKGDVPSGAFVTTTTPAVTAFQAEVRNYWADGSTKFAVLSGIGGTTIQLSATSTAPVTTPEVALTDPLASIVLTGAAAGTYNCPTINVASGWVRGTQALVRKIVGRVMTERHYYVPTSDAHLAVWFFVRSYSNGATEVETVVENGWWNLAGPTCKNYGATVKVNAIDRYLTPWVGGDVGAYTWVSATTFTRAKDYRNPFAPGGTFYVNGNSGILFTVLTCTYNSSTDITTVTVAGGLPNPLTSIYAIGHRHHTRWSRVDWVGTDPAIIPVHDGVYLRKSKIVPNSAYSGASSAALTFVANTENQIPFGLGDYPLDNLNGGGDAKQIGPVAYWDAHWVASQDTRATTATLANARCQGRYSIYYRDEQTGRPVKPRSYPLYEYTDPQWGYATPGVSNHTLLPANTGGNNLWIYDTAHQFPPALCAYLISARWPFLESIQMQASSNAFDTGSSSTPPRGANFLVSVGSGQPRATAWNTRSRMLAALVSPTTIEPLMQAEYAAITQANIQSAYNYWTVTQGSPPSGIVAARTDYQPSQYTPGYYCDSPWQQGYNDIVHGWTVMCEPANVDLVSATNLALYASQHPVGLTGTNATWNYRDTHYAGPYGLGETYATTVWQTWAQLYLAWLNHPGNGVVGSYGAISDADGLSILYGRADQIGWSANFSLILHGALVTAVNVGAPGAAAAYARFTGSSTFQAAASIQKLKDDPRWALGVYP